MKINTALQIVKLRFLVIEIAQIYALGSGRGSVDGIGLAIAVWEFSSALSA